MKLGIFVNTANNLDAVVGVTKAALAKGHEVTIFGMDDGTRLFVKGSALVELSQMKGVAVAFCDHSAKELSVDSSGIPGEVVVGSQYNNAVMNHESDRMIVL